MKSNLIKYILMGLLLSSCITARQRAAQEEAARAAEREARVSPQARADREGLDPDVSPPVREDTATPNDRKVSNIIEAAKGYSGTPYRYGGTTRKGIDCSGLLCNAFREEGISLPRRSADMVREGKSVKFYEIQPGDLLFFKTNRSRTINHSGLVVDVVADKVLFIHSTSSRGVIISSLNEAYWLNSFVEARRVL